MLQRVAAARFLEERTDWVAIFTGTALVQYWLLDCSLQSDCIMLHWPRACAEILTWNGSFSGSCWLCLLWLPHQVCLGPQLVTDALLTIELEKVWEERVSTHNLQARYFGFSWRGCYSLGTNGGRVEPRKVLKDNTFPSENCGVRLWKHSMRRNILYLEIKIRVSSQIFLCTISTSCMLLGAFDGNRDD